MKNWIIGIVVVVILGGVGYFLMTNGAKGPEPAKEEQATTTNQTPRIQTIATTTSVQASPEKEVIGKSVKGYDITADHYGNGKDEILLIAGVHGGYDTNTKSLALGLENEFRAYPNYTPQNLKLTIIPDLNFDGFDKTYPSIGETGNKQPTKELLETGRYNANGVDLNRNFDCGWQPTGVWQNKKVSGGSAPFSEPESQAIRDYINAHHPKAVIVYYSAAGGVYSSSCGNGILPETKTLTMLYAQASGYPAYDKFDAYPTSGDMVNWLAKENIPAISVLLTNHTDTEFDKNLAGVKAVLTYYAK